MSFWKKLFGGAPSLAAAGTDGPSETGKADYKGYVIKAVPFKANGLFQLAGLIEKTIDGQPKSYRFVRADRSADVEEVTHLALAKGEKIIDEQGDAIFD